RHDRRRPARSGFRPCRCDAAERGRGDGVAPPSARGSTNWRGDGVLWNLARRGDCQRALCTEKTCMKTIVLVAALLVAASLNAADQRVDLSKERVGRPPATFEPMVGTWVIADDAGEKVIMVDGRP